MGLSPTIMCRRLIAGGAVAYIAAHASLDKHAVSAVTAAQNSWHPTNTVDAQLLRQPRGR